MCILLQINKQLTVNNQIIINFCLNKKSQNQQNQPMLRQLQCQPKIVFTLPSQSDIINVYHKSPIKHLHNLLHLQQVTKDYQMLFGQKGIQTAYNSTFSIAQKDKEQKQMEKGSNKDKLKHGASYSRRKLNFGQKIRNKLESTNNKSVDMGKQEELIQVISRFCQGSVLNSSQQSKLYQSQDENKNEKALFNQPELIHAENQLILSQKLLPRLPSFSSRQFPYQKNCNILPSQPYQSSSNQKSSLHSSPYNNISAKTHYSPDSYEKLQNHRNQSPIQYLNSLTKKQCFVEQINLDLKALKIHQQGQKQQEQNTWNNQNMIIKIKKVENNLNCIAQQIDFVNIPLVNSRAISQSLQHTYRKIQSFYIPCQNSIFPQKPIFSPYEFAIDQLHKLKQNVCNLETVINNLALIKQTSQYSGIMPSSIKKDNNQNKKNQSFILQINNNFIQSLEDQQKSQQMLLIDQMIFNQSKIQDKVYESSNIESQYYIVNRKNQNILTQINQNMLTQINQNILTQINQNILTQINQNNLFISQTNEHQQNIKSNKNIFQIVGDFSSRLSEINKQNILQQR